ncbi:PREDICTED: uncharacterized protein LOC109587506 [Amphimedon queenslandica]|nr:PREDICTED: uncharacterized protein LOC109587506 [Amphimedon queenslandica]|eukprot:XP_019859309.1 PREDICTED: uncharacterized protein LOC109587506 [Amphimedon queenslandica]
MKEKIQELSLIKKTKEDQNEEECTLVELKEVKEATNDLEKKLERMKKEYHIKCRTVSTSASYKIIKGMRMEIEQMLTNKTGLLDPNESLIDIKSEIAELQEQISVMSLHILKKREENEELMHKIKDYKRITLKLDQEISSEQTLDKREEDQQVIHQEIKKQLDRLMLTVDLQIYNYTRTQVITTGNTEAILAPLESTKTQSVKVREFMISGTKKVQRINLRKIFNQK